MAKKHKRYKIKLTSGRIHRATVTKRVKKVSAGFRAGKYQVEVFAGLGPHKVLFEKFRHRGRLKVRGSKIAAHKHIKIGTKNLGIVVVARKRKK